MSKKPRILVRLTAIVASLSLSTLAHAGTGVWTDGIVYAGTYSGGVRQWALVPPAQNFYTLTPCRLFDTRQVSGPTLGAPLTCGTAQSFTVAGNCDVPASASAVSVNLTGTGSTAPGNLRLFAAGTPTPHVSTLNYAAGQTRANNAVASLGDGGRIYVLCSPSGTTHVVLDVNGYFAGGAASLSLAPSAASFGVVDVGQSVPMPMTLTNGGDASAGTITVQVTGSPAFGVTNDTCSGAALDPLSQCTFTLNFAPSTFGPASATVDAQSSFGLSTSASATGTGRDHVPLAIQFAGDGVGVVNGVEPPCASPGPCTIDVPRTDPTAIPQLDLTAEPDPLSSFGGWGGACTGTGTCSVLMDQPRSVTATFTVRMVPISLTVIGVSGAAGTVAAEDGSISCSGSCPNLSHAATTSFTLVATAAPGSSFIGWTSGPCRGTDPTCTFALTDAVAISATFGPQQAYMFVTSSTVVPGNLGGIEGGDSECQRLADNAGLPGTYMAWLSTTGINARDRVGEGGWMRTDGRPFTYLLKTLADTAVSGYPTVYYPPRIDEAGNDLGNVSTLVATGGNTDGTTLGDQCTGYTRTTGNLYVGDASSGSYAWSYAQLVPGGCSSPFHLYCFRSDVSGGIRPPAQAGRRVFVTSRPYVMSGGGAADPNVFCQEEADDARLPNPQGYVAFLATSTTPAMNLIASTGPWKRTDDVIVASQATDFATGELLAPFSLAPDGVTYRPDRVWTGATDPTVPGTATCNDWGGAVATSALVGDGRTTAAPAWFSLGDTAAIPCSDPNTHLMCLEP
jgi:hypothetical protein